MTKREKLIERLLAKPKDFSWEELAKLLTGFGYKAVAAGKTGGSRTKFMSSDHPPIMLHRPHPRPILKRYQIEEIIELLKQEKLI